MIDINWNSIDWSPSFVPHWKHWRGGWRWPIVPKSSRFLLIFNDAFRNCVKVQKLFVKLSDSVWSELYSGGGRAWHHEGAAQQRAEEGGWWESWGGRRPLRPWTRKCSEVTTNIIFGCDLFCWKYMWYIKSIMFDISNSKTPCHLCI